MTLTLLALVLATLIVCIQLNKAMNDIRDEMRNL